MNQNPRPYRGSCLCGGVTFEVDQIEPDLGHCHCTMCRKFHGAAFATLGEALAENFRWTAGEDLIRDYRADNGTVRSFCGRCGSSLTFAGSASDGSLVEFSMGTLDTPVDERPDASIFLDFKADWYEVTDGLPGFREGRAGPRTS